MKRLMVDSRRILGDPARQIIIRILTIATNKHAIDPSTVGGGVPCRNGYFKKVKAGGGPLLGMGLAGDAEM